MELQPLIEGFMEEKELGFAVCSADSGQGSTGALVYRDEKIHSTRDEAETELNAIRENIRGFYGVCRIVEKEVQAPVQKTVYEPKIKKVAEKVR
jgi:hypothetical protein